MTRVCENKHPQERDWAQGSRCILPPLAVNVEVTFMHRSRSRHRRLEANARRRMRPTNHQSTVFHLVVAVAAAAALHDLAGSRAWKREGDLYGVWKDWRRYQICMYLAGSVCVLDRGHDILSVCSPPCAMVCNEKCLCSCEIVNI